MITFWLTCLLLLFSGVGAVMSGIEAWRLRKTELAKYVFVGVCFLGFMIWFTCKVVTKEQ